LHSKIWIRRGEGKSKGMREGGGSIRKKMDRRRIGAALSQE